MPNRSLDDFASGPADDEEFEDEGVDAETAGETTAEGAKEKGPEPDVDTLATYRWTPTGTTCPQCGDTVEKTWLDGDEYVCSACKDW
ncbi:MULTISPECIES: zinc ribbon domain-containing protein [Haloferax]|uniref:DUF7573 domain-containing protein n=2 Tax=Haloferax TaxID=2251 RepID=A0A6G1Z0J5_9EURY|nr:MULTISPECIES: zinc ribbon domain-containing protein [Haloferax]KAB1187394.1 hypothetical protein Hfx1149_04860 [Haloferax sp. CBA1149]MRW80042.1 hypothetical protein [Haloferax marinisediminis]